MKAYRDIITLNRNARGCYILDTVKGCSYLKQNPKGCYGDCYANNIASRYGFDFSNPVKREFEKDTTQIYFDGFSDEAHESEIIRQIKTIDMPFVRIGEMGDPSENWEHTINICKTISRAGKKIVIITKHWNTISDNLLPELETIDLCMNTSISAMDNDAQIKHRLEQYNRLSKHCNSVLRIVSCDFNTENKIGAKMKAMQDSLFKNKHIDTVFRPNPKNQIVTNNVINTEKVKFLRGEVLASMYNKDTFFGMCYNCPEMCGINISGKQCQ